MKNNTKLAETIFQVFTIILYTVFALFCVYPFYYIFMYSLSDPTAVVHTMPVFMPTNITLANYWQIFELKGIVSAFFVSFARTVVGTLITVLMNAMLAYALTKNRTPFRKFFYRIAVISMYINAGLIPWYTVMVNLGMRNNPLLYILPSAVVVFFFILIKTYIEQLPIALEESALIDGAGFFTIFIKIILPLCKPILAAVAVFSAVNQWNAWTDNFFLIQTKSLQTLQYTLLNYLQQAEAIAQQAMKGNSIQGLKVNLSPMTIKMTLTMVVSLPVIMVYPFMQKYFVKGILIGAVKG